MEALGEEGFKRIREFVASGEGCIGICAGAYTAPRGLEVPGYPPRLGIIAVRNARRAGARIKSIIITRPEHPLLEGCGKEIGIWYKNGPMIEAGEDVEMLAVCEQGFAALVHSTYGEGRAIIFNAHPEGSLEGGVDPGEFETLKLLENAIVCASKGK